MSKHFCLLLALAFAVRLVYVFVFVPVIETGLGITLYNFLDADGYINHATALHEGPYWFTSDYLRRMPFYPALMAFLALLPVPTVATIQVWHILLDCVTMACVYMVVKQLLHERAGLIAGLCYTFYPLAVYRLPMMGTEVIHTTSLALFVLVFFRFLAQPGRLNVFALSVLSIIILFITPVFQFYVIFMAGVIAVLVGLRLKDFFKSAGYVMLYLAPIILLVALWGVRNLEATGQFYLFDVRGGKEFWLGNHVASNGEWEGPYRHIWEAEMREVQQMIEEQGGTKNDENRYFYKKGFNEIINNPAGVAVLWYKKFFRFWYIPASKRMVELTIPIQTFFLGLGLLGICAGVFRYQRKNLLWLLPVIGYYNAIYTLSYACIRFSHPVMPWVCAFTGIGIYFLWMKLKGEQSNV